MLWLYFLKCSSHIENEEDSALWDLQPLAETTKKQHAVKCERWTVIKSDAITRSHLFELGMASRPDLQAWGFGPKKETWIMRMKFSGVVSGRGNLTALKKKHVESSGVESIC